MDMMLGKDMIDQLVNKTVSAFTVAGMPMPIGENESSMKAKLKKIFGDKLNQKIINEALVPEYTEEEIIQLVQIFKTPLMKKYLSNAPKFVELSSKIIQEYVSTFNFDESIF